MAVRNKTEKFGKRRIVEKGDRNKILREQKKIIEEFGKIRRVERHK